jgi:hypothetical protein
MNGNQHRDDHAKTDAEHYVQHRQQPFWKRHTGVFASILALVSALSFVAAGGLWSYLHTEAGVECAVIGFIFGIQSIYLVTQSRKRHAIRNWPLVVGFGLVFVLGIRAASSVHEEITVAAVTNAVVASREATVTAQRNASALERAYAGYLRQRGDLSWTVASPAAITAGVIDFDDIVTVEGKTAVRLKLIRRGVKIQPWGTELELPEANTEAGWTTQKPGKHFSMTGPLQLTVTPEEVPDIEGGTSTNIDRPKGQCSTPRKTIYIFSSYQIWDGFCCRRVTLCAQYKPTSVCPWQSITPGSNRIKLDDCENPVTEPDFESPDLCGYQAQAEYCSLRYGTRVPTPTTSK